MKKLMVVLAMFTTGMVAAQSGSVKTEEVLLITKNYDANNDDVREDVISMCRKKLNENNIDILHPHYREVQIVFRDKKHNMNKLLFSSCKDYILDEDDYVRCGWRLDDSDSTWLSINLEIEPKFVRYTIERIYK